MSVKGRIIIVFTLRIAETDLHKTTIFFKYDLVGIEAFTMQLPLNAKKFAFQKTTHLCNIATVHVYDNVHCIS